MKALIIEDETAAALNLKAILKQAAPDIRVVDTLESVEESVDWLRANPQPDLLFMDIHLADGDSFRIFDAVEVTAPVIFTTAYDRYALEAFKVNSIDYLLKPLNAADVQRALDKLMRLSKGERSDYGSRVRTLAAARREQTFLVHVRDKIIPLKREDIAFCYTCNEKVTAYTFAGASYPLDARSAAGRPARSRFLPRQPPVHRGAPRREGDFRVVRQPSFAESCARNS